MATLVRRLLERIGVRSMFMLSGLVGTLCWCGAPALASVSIPLPPQVPFISQGKYTGTFQTQGVALPITGTLDYLGGVTQYLKLQVSFDTGGQQITRDSWVTSTATVINECEIVSTDPTTCRKEVLSGDSYPQCTAWSQTTGKNTIECTVTVQGNKATLDISVVLNSINQLVQLEEKITINGMTDSLSIMMTEQATTPPPVSAFNRPSNCSAPNGNNQGGNDNSQGQIPLQSLLWLI